MELRSSLYINSIKFILLVFSYFILSSTAVIAQPTSQTFNSSGTYTVPAGYSAVVTIGAWGGGGGGGTNSGNAKGGGGGGAYASINTTLSAGSYAVTVGTGGGTGTAGVNSSFTTLVVAVGGSSTTTATGGAGGTTAASTGNILFAGGNGGNGASTTSIRGGGGGGGSATAGGNGGNGGNGVAGGAGTGGAGGSGTGAGGNGADDNGTPDATTGTAAGGGGGGRGNSGNSKAGAAGRVIVTVNIVLSVHILNIAAYEKQTGIQIEWTTISENNLRNYQIEHSSDGRVFNVIGEVTARNSVTETKYQWVDNNPLPRLNFYRIKTVDNDGKFSYSIVIRINPDKASEEITVYPNPVQEGHVSFQISELQKGNYSVKIYNSNGRQLYNQPLIHNGGALSKTIQLPQSTGAGIYFLLLGNDSLKAMSKAFLAQ